MPPTEETSVSDPAPATATASTAPSMLAPLPVFKPDLYERAWQSIPHPTLPLLATAHQKSVTVFSLSTLSGHSSLTNGHERSVRSAAWKPNLPPHKLCLVTGSFDATAGLWRWEDSPSDDAGAREVEVTGAEGSGSGSDKDDKDWELIVVLDGHDSEIKSVAFSPAGQFLATCSRDKSVWVWEDVGASEADDEWETVAVLGEHDGDVKSVAWCPEAGRVGRGRYAGDALASASYDDTVRVWREDADGEWVCVAVLEGHAGTVWGVQWEPGALERFPRLLSWSADQTVRVWTLQEEEEEDDEDDAPAHAWGGRIPNTMRRSLKEEWRCSATLPRAHTRDVYSASWSGVSGRIASTGSDGIVAVYEEQHSPTTSSTSDDETAAHRELDGEDDDDDDVPMTNGHHSTAAAAEEKKREWRLVSRTPNAHGPYEVNHVTWCRRFDADCAPERRGVEEMLVTTGDDGIVRPWRVLL
ncbi:WD repeat protein [Xylariomycetidae sp. FL0641]|nr:WD repeat protein [Xylariomycetidae sp. FL0641]